MFPKLYVLVRRDLPKSYRMVQGMHAVALFTEKNKVRGDGYWNPKGTIVSLLAVDEEHLQHIHDYMGNTIGITIAKWTEPDLNDELTAVAFVSTGEGLEQLPLA